MPIEYKIFNDKITLSKVWYAGNMSLLLLIAENLNQSSSIEIGVCMNSNNTALSPSRDSERRICLDGKIILIWCFKNITVLKVIGHQYIY